jgi:hypothetical protein
MSKCRLDIEKDIRSSYKRVLEKEVSDFIVKDENSLYSIELNYKGNNNKETVRRKVYLANKKAGLNYGIYNNSDEIKIDVPQKDIDIAWEDYQKSNPIQTETETIINTEQINQKLINGFLKDFNIDTEDFENLKDAIGFDAYTASDLIAKAIVYEKGESITPEVAYFAYSMLGKQNNKLSSELKYLINKWDKYNERFEYHKNIQKEKIGFISDKKEWINKIRDLVILDFLKEKIEQHYINPQKFKKSLDTKWTSEDFSIWNKIISWLENLLSSYSSKYKSQKEKLSDIGLSIADEILNRNYEYFNYNLKEEQIQKYYKNTIESDAFAKELVEFVQQQLNLVLTGSLALRKAGAVYRTADETLHDIDWVVPYELNMVNNKVIQPLINPLTGQLPKNLLVVDEYLNALPWYKEFKQKYPSYKIINGFYGKEHTAYESMTVQGVIDGKFYDKNGVHTEEKSYYKKDEITKKPIKVTETIKVSHKKGDLIPNTGYVIDFFIRLQPKQEEHENYFKLWKEIMIAKIKMGRDKDFIDWKAFVPYLKSKNSFNFNYEGFRHINYESSSKYLLDDSIEIVNTKPIIDEIKPGVEELFDSNPELANQVYEALGFSSISDVTLDKPRFNPDNSEATSYPIKINGKSAGVISIDNEGYISSSIGMAGVELEKEFQGKGYGTKVYLALANKLAEEGKTLKSEAFGKDSISAQASNLWKSLLNKGLAVDKGDYFEVISTITPQQKQQALQAYSQYLDTIFPDSQVKDILYHMTSYNGKKGIEQKGRFLKPGEEGYQKRDYATTGGIYFTDNNSYDEDTEMYGSPVTGAYGSAYVSAILNIKKPLVDLTRSFGDISKTELKDNDGFVGTNESKEIGVLEPEQIHILGSKQDVEGFKEFVKDKPTQANNESGMSMTAQEYEIFNQDTEIQENKKCK